MLRRFSLPLISLILLCNLSTAAETYTYPELNVTPLSSKRLKIEARKEQKRGFLTHSSMQLSSLATILSGAMMLDNTHNDKKSDPNKASAIIGLSVGTLWLFLPNLLGKKKFTKAYRSIHKLPTKSKRNKLLRERLAEEELKNIRSFSKKMRIASAAMNIGALGYMMSNAKSDSIAQPALIVSMVLAAAPLLLSCPWKTPADQQEIYKKKIYAPIASATLLKDPKSDKLVPGLLVGLRF